MQQLGRVMKTPKKTEAGTSGTASDCCRQILTTRSGNARPSAHFHCSGEPSTPQTAAKDVESRRSTSHQAGDVLQHSEVADRQTVTVGTRPPDTPSTTGTARECYFPVSAADASSAFDWSSFSSSFLLTTSLRVTRNFSKLSEEIT